MAIIPETQYTGKIDPSTPAYPYGKARNITLPGDGTGTPLEAAWLNDLFGLQQSLLSDAALVPDGNADYVGKSQYAVAIVRIISALSGSIKPTKATLIADVNARIADPDGKIRVGELVAMAENASGKGGYSLFSLIDGVSSRPAETALDNYPIVGGSGFLYLKRINLSTTTPEQAGAVSDGSTDDTTPVQSVIDAAKVMILDYATRHDADIWDADLLSHRSDTVRLAARANWQQLPNIFGRIKDHIDSAPAAIQIVSVGSSVGDGAALPTPATQNPGYIFAQRFISKFNKLGNLTINFDNLCVPGSGVNSLDTDADPDNLTYILANYSPDLLVMFYGMNDGRIASYHSGQTYSGVQQYLRKMINQCKEANCDVIIVTSPHSKTDGDTLGEYDLVGTINSGYSPVNPTAAAGDLVPAGTEAASIVSGDWSGLGVTINASYRHYRFNQMLRHEGALMGIPVIDAEQYYFEAMARAGTSEVFYPDTGVNGVVHPNLYGHRQSYWRAMYDYIDALAESYQTSGGANYQQILSRVGVNAVSDAALTLKRDLWGPSPTEKVFKALDDSNAEVVSIGQNGFDYLYVNEVIAGIRTNVRSLAGDSYVATFRDEDGNIMLRLQNKGTKFAEFPEADVVITPRFKRHLVLDDTSKIGSDTSWRQALNIGGSTTIAIGDETSGWIKIVGVKTAVGRQNIMISFNKTSGVLVIDGISDIGAAVLTYGVSGSNNLDIFPASGVTTPDVYYKFELCALGDT